MEAPTRELYELFESRTGGHIRRVVRNALGLVESGVVGESEYFPPAFIVERCVYHDISKWGFEEYVPYVWLTYFRSVGLGDDIPVGFREGIERAIYHHVHANRHHPEFFGEGLGCMGVLDIAEMVCDWAAVSQEFNSSLFDWVINTGFREYKFDKGQRRLILEFAEVFEPRGEWRLALI